MRTAAILTALFLKFVHHCAQRREQRSRVHIEPEPSRNEPTKLLLKLSYVRRLGDRYRLMLRTLLRHHLPKSLRFLDQFGAGALAAFYFLEQFLGLLAVLVQPLR